MQTGRILTDIKKQTTTAQQLQIIFCLRHPPLPHRGLCYIIFVAVSLCCWFSYPFKPCDFILQLPISATPTFYAHLSTSGKPGNSTSYRGEPSSRFIWAAVWTESSEDPLIPRKGQGHSDSALLHKCYLKFATPEVSFLLSQFNQLIHFRCAPSTRQHLNNAEYMKQGMNMNRVLHYGKKRNMSFLPPENEPENMYSSWNAMLIFFSWNDNFQLSIASFSSNTEKEIEQAQSLFKLL